MSAQCTDHCHTPTASADPRYRRILWIALLVNAAMFVVELGAGLSSGSASLLADAIDFLGDAANYGVSLLVLAMALQWRARGQRCSGRQHAGLRGVCDWPGGLGRMAGHHAQGAHHGLGRPAGPGCERGRGPAPYTPGAMATPNMRGVWLCTRNDALSNVAVMLAALGVFGTGRSWPDLVVAGVMAALAISRRVERGAPGAPGAGQCFEGKSAAGALTTSARSYKINSK